MRLINTGCALYLEDEAAVHPLAFHSVISVDSIRVNGVDYVVADDGETLTPVVAT
jgi:hypothetical protein